jgi:tRNA uridine 5-carboxymethylaminomethyl modification enzyme
LPEPLEREPQEIRDESVYRVAYQGYLAREHKHVAKLTQLEALRIPGTLDFSEIRGLRRESVMKLTDIKPATLGQASRISGVSPADISILMIRIESDRRAAALDSTS